MRKSAIVLCYILLSSVHSNIGYGQSVATPLETVIVLAPIHAQYAVGFRVQKVDSLLMQRYQHGTISDLLSFSSTLGIKNYGVGKLSTSSLRGMSAVHTAVLWNGININQPNLGQSDFSTLPMLGFEQVFIQYGGAGNLFGSGAVGGTIMLQSKPTWSKKISSQANLSANMFSNTNAKISFASGKTLKNGYEIESKLGLLRNDSPNNFPNNERRLISIGKNTLTQQGISADIYLKTPQNSFWSFNTYLGNSDLIIEPNFDAARQVTNDTRLALSYTKNKLALKLALLRDGLDYYSTTKTSVLAPSKALNHRWIARGEYEFDLWKGANIKSGIDYSYWQTKVDSYGNMPITENRLDVYALAKQNLDRLSVSATLRQSIVQGYNPPLNPALGIAFDAIKTPKIQLIIKGNLSKNYRVPTLNERYWLILGNPTIKPENGFNKEIGLVWNTLGKYYKYELGVNYYHNMVNDWVYWNPERNYKVENLQKVKATGLEVFSSLKYIMNKHSFNILIQYSYTKSTQELAYSSFSADLIGKQLVYVPIHQGVINGSYQYKKIAFTIQNQMMGKRYIDFDNQQFLPAFMLINTQLAYQSSFQKIRYQILLNVNNVSNGFYLNVERKAMPGRLLGLSLAVQY